MNLADLLFSKADEQPNRPLFYGHGSGSWTTYGHFAVRVNKLADALGAMGVKAGVNVGLLHPSGEDYIAFVYAVWKCGACVTPLPSELTATEKKQILESIHIDFVICARRLLNGIHDSASTAAIAVSDHADLVKVSAPCVAPPGLAAVNVAFIRFTSGTTGCAKGVVLSHESVYKRIHAANQVLAINERDNIVWLLSMDYHFTVSIVAYLTYGAGLILPKNSFGETVLAAALQHGATILYASPVHYNFMIQEETGITLPAGLRLLIVTTAALRPETAVAFYERFGRALNETYGIIELGLPAINVDQSPAHQGSVGRTTPGYELQLDRQSGEHQGEILLRGDGMLDAYYTPWKPQQDILRDGDGWFRTGDVGRLDANGYLYIVGRVKEMISVGGLKFFPEEVESVLENHPAVREAAVFGIEQRHWGEACVAQLVAQDSQPAPDEAQLRKYCSGLLANHKVPGRFEWTEQLSRTASGKKIRNRERLLQQHL